MSMKFGWQLFVIHITVINGFIVFSVEFMMYFYTIYNITETMCMVALKKKWLYNKTHVLE